MFDIGFFELILIGIIGLVVLGPERLPHAIRMTSAWIGKIRRASISVRSELEREVNAHEMKKRIQEQMEQAGFDDIKQSLDSVKALANEDMIKLSTLSKTNQPPDSEPSEPQKKPPDTQHANSDPE